MNCKPGDLAVIRGCVEAVDCNGMLVTVLENVRGNEWTAPDGYMFEWGGVSPSTAVESLGSSFDARDERTMYAVFESRCVVPIRPGDISDEEVRDLYSPLPSKEREEA